MAVLAGRWERTEGDVVIDGGPRAVLAGVHRGAVVVRGGGHLDILGDLIGSLDIEQGGVELRHGGTVSGDVTLRGQSMLDFGGVIRGRMLVDSGRPKPRPGASAQGYGRA